MKTVLQKTPLRDLLNRPILFDANIFMVGIERRSFDENYSFDSIANLFIRPLLESFSDIYIHLEVYNELDENSKVLVDEYVGRNVKIVDEDGMYGVDPKYTTIFNNIAGHDLVNYVRGQSKDRGETYSLAYAAYNNINYFCSREVMVDLVASELEDLAEVDVVTLDVILLLAYVYYANRNDNSHSRALKSVYKTYCRDVIKRHNLPATLGEYILAIKDYI